MINTAPPSTSVVCIASEDIRSLIIVGAVLLAGCSIRHRADMRADITQHTPRMQATHLLDMLAYLKACMHAMYLSNVSNSKFIMVQFKAVYSIISAIVRSMWHLYGESSNPRAVTRNGNSVAPMIISERQRFASTKWHLVCSCLHLRMLQMITTWPIMLNIAEIPIRGVIC